jgi:hypothetical protein
MNGAFVKSPDFSSTELLGGPIGADLDVASCAGRAQVGFGQADGKGGIFVMAFDGSWNILNLNPVTGVVRKVAGPFFAPTAMALDPEAKMLVTAAGFGGVEGVWRVDVATQAVERIGQVKPKSLTISADGNWILSVEERKGVENIVRQRLATTP